MPEVSPDAAASLTLFYAPRTRSFTALWLLEELGEPYRLESFDLNTGRHKQPDYLALNAMGKVPVVRDGEVPVSELGAIAIYLADRFPNAALAPSPEAPERAAYLRWMFFSSAIMEPAFAEKFFGWNPPARQVAWGSYGQMLEVLTRGVDTDGYLLGDRFSAADVLIGAGVGFGVRFGALPNDGPIAAYLARVSARPAFARASAIEAREGERFPLKQ